MTPTDSPARSSLPRHRPFPGIAALVPVALLCGLLGASLGAARGPSFDDSTTVLVVEVPVNVHRDGEAVRGLTRDDFVVREGRKEWPLVGFEVIDLATLETTDQRPVADEVPIAARRHFLLLFDLSTGGLAGLDGARDLVRSGLHSTDLVGVGVYGRAGTGLVLGFTSDRQQVLSVLDRLGGAVGTANGDELPEVGRRDPLRLMPDTRAIDIAREALEMDLGGRGSNAEVYFDMNRANVAQGRARARAEVERFSDALGRLADATARLDGRKFLVLFSAGFDDDLFYEEELLTRRSLLDSREGSTALRDLQGMSERFRKAGWTIQSVDSAGLQEGRGLSGGTSMSLLASETGGETYRNFNDLGTAMDQMLGRTSVTYLLAFQADGVPIDGDYHEIEIELRDRQRGVRMLHRPGYYAPQPLDADLDDDEAAIGAMAGTFSVAELLLSGETSGEIETSTLTSTFRRDQATTTTTWIDVAGRDLVGDRTSGSLAVEVFAYVLDASGGVADFSTRTLNLDLDKVGERLKAGGLRLLSEFDLEPGRYDLRLLVRDPASDRHALRRVAIEVPSLGATASTLLPPFLLDDRGEALVIRDQPSEGETDDYPFVAGEAEVFVPAVDPVLGSPVASRVCLMGYHLTREGLILDAAVYDVTGDATGERLGQERVGLVGRSETTADGLDRLYLSLDTAGLAEGTYELRASIRDESSGIDQTVASPFRIGR